MTDLEKKLWKRANRYVRILRFIPFIRMVAVCNNLAFSKIDGESDIDLFIVARSGRLFTARILVTLLFQILGVRRHGQKVARRFCLSFFVDDSVLNLSGIAIERDIYLAFWIASMKPIIDDGVSGEFLAANSWVKRYFEDVVVLDRSRVIRGGGVLRSVFRWILAGRFGDLIEKWMRNWQMKRARAKVKRAGENASLIVEENILKFHNVDRRREYRNQWFRTYGEDAKLRKEAFLRLNVEM